MITLEDRTFPNSALSLFRTAASSRSERSIFRATHTVSAVMPCQCEQIKLTFRGDSQAHILALAPGGFDLCEGLAFDHDCNS